jgi:hypothetical protein
MVTSALYASAARADPESDAKDLFARAHAMRKAGDCAGAVPLFRKALATFPKGLGSLRNIAECEETIGHFASSRRAWLDLKRALIVQPDTKYDGWEKDCDDAAARLLPKVATVTVDVTVKTPQSEGPANERSGVELLVNGESVGTNLVGTPLERDPGTYTIRAQAPDAQAVDGTVSLVAGDKKHLALRLVVTPKEGVPVTSPGVAEPPREPRDNGNGQRTLGWIVAGAGGAALVGSLVTFLLYNGAKSDVTDTCGGNLKACSAQPNQVEDKRSTGNTMGTLSPILLGVGIVGIGAGLALVFTSGPSKTGLTITPRATGADATWRF